MTDAGCGLWTMDFIGGRTPAWGHDPVDWGNYRSSCDTQLISVQIDNIRYDQVILYQIRWKLGGTKYNQEKWQQFL